VPKSEKNWWESSHSRPCVWERTNCCPPGVLESPYLNQGEKEGKKWSCEHAEGKRQITPEVLHKKGKRESTKRSNEEGVVREKAPRAMNKYKKKPKTEHQARTRSKLPGVAPKQSLGHREVKE